MNRRRYLGVIGGLLSTLAGCSALGGPPRGQWMSTLYGGKGIVYTHDYLELTGPDQSIRVGEAAEFTLTNTGGNSPNIGCGSTWTFQRKDGDSWRELLYTTAEGTAGCAGYLDPGESRTTRLTLDKAGVEENVGGTLVEEFAPGQYRFVWLGTDPFLAVRFRIDAS